MFLKDNCEGFSSGQCGKVCNICTRAPLKAARSPENHINVSEFISEKKTDFRDDCVIPNRYLDGGSDFFGLVENPTFEHRKGWDDKKE